MSTNEILRELHLTLGKASKSQVVRAYRLADDGGTIQAWQGVELFPGQPTRHTAISLTDALLALGCERADAREAAWAAAKDAVAAVRAARDAARA